MALTRPRYSNIVDTDYKASCRVVTTTNITLSGGSPSTYDGVSLLVGDRILVAGQATGSQNGIYIVQTVGTGSNGTWARSFDANNGERLTAGLQTNISEGTYAGKNWRLTTPDPITVGSTNLTFVESATVAAGINRNIQFNNSNEIAGADALNYFSANTSLIAAGNIFATTIYTNQLKWEANNQPVTLTGNVNPTIYVSNTAVSTAMTKVDTLPAAGNTYIRWNIVAKDQVNNRYRFVTVESVNDTANVYYNEYSSVKSNSMFEVAEFTSNITSGNINLWATGDSATVYVNFQRTMLGAYAPTGYINNFGPIGPAGSIAETSSNIVTTATSAATSTTTGALQVAGGAGIAGNIYVGENAVVGTDLTVLGNLSVLGEVTTFNTATLTVEDLSISLANGAATSGAANGAGISVSGPAGAQISYFSSSDAWNLNKNTRVTALYTGSGIFWTGNSAVVRTGIQYTTSVTAPTGANYGDKWYDTTTDILYEWQTSDGVNGFWVDVGSLAITTNSNTLTANTIISTGNVVLGGNLLLTNGYANITYTPSTTVGAGIRLFAANTQGGTGYADFLQVTNVSGGATNPNKSFRLNSTGFLEIVNSAYTATLLSLSDVGVLSANSGIQVNGKQAVNGPAFRAYPSGSQTITSGSLQKVTFGSESFDTDGCFASSRFTPTVEGYYQLNATVRLDGANGTGECMIVLYKNGSEYARGWNSSGTQFAASFWSMTVTDIAYANGTSDYFEIYIQQTSGVSLTTTAFQNISYFSGCMIRGA
jgi:hypothetical protein